MAENNIDFSPNGILVVGPSTYGTVPPEEKILNPVEGQIYFYIQE